MPKARRVRAEIFSGAPPLTTWPTVLAASLPEDHREIFHKRSQAVSMYAEGYSVAEIQEVTGVRRSMLPYLALKCLERSTDGRIMGYRGLIPYSCKRYIRKADVRPKLPEAKGGLSGVFNQTLLQFPKLKKKLVQAILKRNSPEIKVHEKKLRAKDVHRIFIKYLREAGLEPGHWPFNTKFLGLRTIEKYVSEILDEFFHRSVTAREERAAIAHLSVGTGHERLLTFEEPYDAVQLDAYSINAFFTAEFLTPEGTIQHLQLERIWLLALIEVVSSAILSYSIVYRSEVGADDVLNVIKKAVNLPHKIDITIPGLVYPHDAGLPCEVIPQYQGAVWGVLLLDGALAHLSQAVHSRARSALGCSINWGPVGHFERRPDIEHFFSRISTELFMRLPSTTGSNPGKGRAKDAEEKAIRYKIDCEEIEQLVSIEIAQFNSIPDEGSSYHSPLDVLRYFIEKRSEHFIPRHLPIRAGASVVIIPLILICTVRGGRESGRRPYIQIDGVRYTNPILAQAVKLVGEKLSIEVDEEDMRYCKAYFPDGSELGILKAGGRWSETKHSRKTRKAIQSLISRKILIVTSQQDPVQTYLGYLSTPEKRRGKKKSLLTPKQATEAHRVAKESGLQKQLQTQTDLQLSSEPSLSQLQHSRPVLMGDPMPNLNELIKRKR